MNQTIIAIDPGASGGIAVQYNGLSEACFPMPDTEGDICAELITIRDGARLNNSLLVAFIEENTGFCGVQIPSHTMFKLGRNTGFIHGALQALGYRIESVTPQKWVKALGLGTRSGASKTEWKNKLKAKAQQLYPNLKVTLATSDALLILEYGKRQSP